MMAEKNKITKCTVRMYTMGTGDCFVLSFKNKNDRTKFKLMIDCGVQQIGKDEIEPYAKDIIAHTGGEVDALLITHEHQDHVLGFQRAEDLFTGNSDLEPKPELKLKELWLPWTENDKDEKAGELKDQYGKKKKALALAADYLKNKIEEDSYTSIYDDGSKKGEMSMNIRRAFSDSLNELAELNVGELPNSMDDYVGGLVGMTVVKEKLKRKRKEPRYLDTGTVIENIEGLENIRIYVLGPPSMWKAVKKEHGKDGETYKHNKEIEFVRGFSSLPFEEDEYDTCPFDGRHIVGKADLEIKKEREKFEPIRQEYEHPDNNYRRINYDWLMSAANLSLRLTRGINNLSAVLAIEFIESGKVMLFPGDAEFGSWNSWHDIKWNEKGKDGKTHLTTDLLNRTVFYKVAHHMSHNGTAKEKGIDLMTHKDLVAMATLDYEVISKNWKNTMPNRGLVRDLLDKTKGRLILLNAEGIPFDKAKTKKLVDEIDKRRENLGTKKRKEFEGQIVRAENPEFKKEDGGSKRKYLYVEYTVDGK